MRYAIFPLALVLCAALAGCGIDEIGSNTADNVTTDPLAYHDGYWVSPPCCWTSPSARLRRMVSQNERRERAEDGRHPQRASGARARGAPQ